MPFEIKVVSQWTRLDFGEPHPGVAVGATRVIEVAVHVASSFFWKSLGHLSLMQSSPASESARCLSRISSRHLQAGVDPFQKAAQSKVSTRQHWRLMRKMTGLPASRFLKALIARNPIRQVEFHNGLDETLKFKSRSDVRSALNPALLLSKRAMPQIKKARVSLSRPFLGRAAPR
jgi:hypothetical protein